MLESAVVKFYNAEKGYGFVTREGQPDVFFHHNTLSRCNVSPVDLYDGRVVQVQVVPSQKPGKGPQVASISLS